MLKWHLQRVYFKGLMDVRTVGRTSTCFWCWRCWCWWWRWCLQWKTTKIMLLIIMCLCSSCGLVYGWWRILVEVALVLVASVIKPLFFKIIFLFGFWHCYNIFCYYFSIICIFSRIFYNIFSIYMYVCIY